MTNFIGHDNIALNICRQVKAGLTYQHCLVGNTLAESSYVSGKTAEIAYSLPLYVYHNDGARTPNLATTELRKLMIHLTSEPTPEDIFDYVYAVLYSPNHREKYRDFLKRDFPRVPIPTQADFDRLVPLGKELCELHLMKSASLNSYETTYPEAGSDMVEKVSYSAEKIWINDDQYFGNVPEIAWNFYIGGYQPAQKWLKDRKGSILTNADLEHYQKIIKVMLETDKLMHLIDKS